ncbi:MAG: hypothetical protein WCD53_28910 [Microcoleus sp.]
MQKITNINQPQNLLDNRLRANLEPIAKIGSDAVNALENLT